MMQYTPNQLVFSDESAYDRQTLFRRYSWNKSGFRARSSCFFIRGRKYTIEAALCINGLLAYGFQKGPMDFKDYEYFIEFVLLPKMNPFPGPYSVLVLDNATIHRGQHLKDICEQQEVKLEFLPPYSPDYNPNWVESIEDPEDALDYACMQIDKDLARACYQHSGYMS
ncbi:unnamed protein product [Rhizophagus irregularis]|uniref:Tc1-like transposase DDE domain-containing protein n=1 Tax=Rhizophagus irregularis TaxID=588596 RepID=A0A915ZCD5_9GLOM|nr:unnamed protein product [Rhizophagus irregularis]